MPIKSRLVSFSFSISLEYDMIHRRRIIFDIWVILKLEYFLCPKKIKKKFRSILTKFNYVQEYNIKKHIFAKSKLKMHKLKKYCDFI